MQGGGAEGWAWGRRVWWPHAVAAARPLPVLLCPSLWQTAANTVRAPPLLPLRSAIAKFKGEVARMGAKLEDAMALAHAAQQQQQPEAGEAQARSTGA